MPFSDIISLVVAKIVAVVAVRAVIIVCFLKKVENNN
jgi:hypothetical protein